MPRAPAREQKWYAPTTIATVVFKVSQMYHVRGARGSSGEFRPSFAITGQTAGGPSNIISYPLPVHDRRAMGTITQMTEALRPRHPALVRVTHWLITLSFLALLVTGVEILISHPRFYWGETGNVNTRRLIHTADPILPRHRPHRLRLRAS